MESYLSHQSAAVLWDIPNIDVVLGFDPAPSGITETTVATLRERRRKKGTITHLRDALLPPGATVQHRGVHTASPELLFLEFAENLSIQRLIFLGLQMCSHPPGKPAQAITSKEKISKFLSKVSGHRGGRKAGRAAKYLADGSASVMESLAYMVFSLPHSLGGYGLKGAVFNFRIELDADAKKRLGQRYCYTDIYYGRAKLAVEYNSFAHHGKPSQQGKDAVRSAILERQGITVMALNTIQLYDAHACRDFALNLAAGLGARMQIRTEKFEAMNRLLREMLPSRDSAYLNRAAWKSE
ncbi:MAG: hypothetical protein LBS91_01760 [Clostridiales Family XIII bacterium]|jgi:hypothetical protein|nr:hypothetical protein [Clostridiales Family XIII bacterium]